MASDKFPFIPARGLDANIRKQEPKAGMVWFATDTRKIYYSNGEELLLMGGSSGVFYGNFDTTAMSDNDTQFDFEPSEETIEHYDTNKPQPDDLILNQFDHCFYRVAEIDVTIPSIIVTKLTIAGSGGGGGGSDDPNRGSAKVTIVGGNTISVLKGHSCILSFDVECKDNAGQNTTGSSVSWFINRKPNSVYTMPVETGHYEIDIGPYLDWNTSQNTIQGQFSMDIGTDSLTLLKKGWIIKIVDVSLDWPYDFATINKLDSFTFSWRAMGGVEKTTHIWLDNQQEITIDSTMDTTQTYRIDRSEYEAYMSHGVHTFSMYVSAEVNGVTFTTPTVSYPVIFVESGNNTPIIASPIGNFAIQQYDTKLIPLVVYNATSAEGNIEVAVQENSTPKTVISGLTSGERFNWTYSPLEAGENVLSFICGVASLNMRVSVEALDFGAMKEPDDYIFKLKASMIGSNADLKKWTSNGIGAAFSDNFDWVNGGLKQEDDGTPYVCIKAGTTMTINYQPFASHMADKGKCLKIIYKATNCCDYDALVLNCRGEKGPGLVLRAQNSIYATDSRELSIPYCEDTRMELEYDVWPSSSSIAIKEKYIMGWLDGVPCAVAQYGADGFSQSISNGVTNIVIGSDDCDVYIYLIKVYQRHLSDEEHLANFIFDAANASEMVERYRRNDILNERGEISWQKLVEKNPGVQVHLYDIPHIPIGKKDADIVNVDEYLMYENGDSTNYALYAQNAKIKTQGTSSMAYGVAAYNLDTDFKDTTMYGPGGVELTEGYQLSEYAFPQKYFNTKVNVASCEGANNAVNQAWYNDFQPYINAYRDRTKNDKYRARDTMEFVPAVIFITDRSTKTDGTTWAEGGIDNIFKDTEGYVKNPYPKLYSVGNFGNSKKNTDTFHDPNNPNEMCIEIADNQQNLQHMILREDDPEYLKAVAALNTTTEEFTLRDFVKYSLDDGAYDSRYPKYKKLTNEQKEAWADFVEWMSDCNPTGATGYDLKSTNAVEIKALGKHHLNAEDDYPTFKPYTFRSTIPYWDDGINGESHVYHTKLGGITVKDFSGESGRAYTKDTYEYRMAKMLSECEDHLIMDSVVYHYLMIERHLLVDNVAKNTFWSTEDLKHWQLTKDYDNDTADGNDNNGNLTLTYGIEPGDVSNLTNISIFNAYNSVWLHFIMGLREVRAAMHSALNINNGAWSAQAYLDRFTQFQSVIPERCWIEDYHRKYLRPYEVYDDSSYFLKLEGGKKTHQRKQFEIYEEKYFNSEYNRISEDTNVINLRGNIESAPEEIKIPFKMYADCYLRYSLGQMAWMKRVKRNTVEYITLPKGTNLTDSTFYIFMPEYFTHLGDLAITQPKNISLASASRLNELTLGESAECKSINAFSIKGCKLLRKLIAKNLIGDNGKGIETLDLINQTCLRELDTTNSAFTSILLPPNAPLANIILNAPTSIYAKNLYNLNKLSFQDKTQIKGLYLDNIDQNTNFNSGELVKEIINNLTQYSLLNVKWNFNDINDVAAPHIEVLDKLKSKIAMTVGSDGSASETQDKWRALSGNLTIGATAYNGTESIGIYNEYYETYPDLNIDFENESSKIFNVNILNGDGSILWTRKIRNGDSVTEEFLNGGPRGAFDISKVAKGNTRAETFTFANKWQTKDGVVIDKEIPIPDFAITSDITIKPIFNSAPRYYSVIFKNYNDEIIADFSGDNKVPYGTKLLETCYPTNITPIKSLSSDGLYQAWRFLGYSTNRNASQAMRFTDDAIVDNDMTYYAIYSLINDVRTKATDNKYFIFTEYNYTMNGENLSGYSISPNPKLLPNGKITIPANYNGKPVLRLGSFVNASDITHVFFEGNGNHPLRYIYQEAFKGCKKLKYFAFNDLPKLYKIDISAFENVLNLCENDNIGQSVVVLGRLAFSAAFNFNETKITKFTFPSSAEVIGWRAFSFNLMNHCDFWIGTPNLPSNLDIGRSIAEDNWYIYINGNSSSEQSINWRQGIVQNTAEAWRDFYAYRPGQPWNVDDNYSVVKNGIPYNITVGEFFGFTWDGTGGKPTGIITFG